MARENLTVRVRREVRDALEEQAATQRRSVSSMVEVILEDALRVPPDDGTGGTPSALTERGRETVGDRGLGADASSLGAEPTARRVDIATASPRSVSAPAKGKQRARTSMCEHRIPAGQFCKHCDN